MQRREALTVQLDIAGRPAGDGNRVVMRQFLHVLSLNRFAPGSAIGRRRQTPHCTERTISTEHGA
jgi:hypothetical protein